MSRRLAALPQLGIAALVVLAAPSVALAQGELFIVDFQQPPPYRVRSGTTSTSSEMMLQGPVGPKGTGRLWNYTHLPSGGWNNRAFVRYSWWDWDVSRVGHESGPAGWTESAGPFRPAVGWPGNGPYYLRFRIRVAAPILAHAANGSCDGRSHMKFFMWNNYTPEGTDRAIMYLHAGNENYLGGNELTHTTVDLGAGVAGSKATALIPNGEWVSVQIAWRWGSESSGFQRIYVNNNNMSAPNAENRVFDDLDYWASDTWGPVTGPTGLSNQFFWGDISTSGSCVREDALIDLMDMEVASQFDPDWAGPRPPSNVRILRSDASSLLLLPLALLALALRIRQGFART